MSGIGNAGWTNFTLMEHKSRREFGTKRRHDLADRGYSEIVVDVAEWSGDSQVQFVRGRITALSLFFDEKNGYFLSIASPANFRPQLVHSPTQYHDSPTASHLSRNSHILRNAKSTSAGISAVNSSC